MTEPLSGIHHNLDNETYREAPGLSATFLKSCLRSVKHALTPKPRTKALDTGLRLHEFILERDSFLSRYVQGLDPNDYPDALQGAEDLRAEIKQVNESRKPALKTTGSRDSLLESIVSDDPTHIEGVVDTAKLTVADLKKKIAFINSHPKRGMLSTGGTLNEMSDRLRNAGYTGDIWPELVEQHASAHPDRVILPPDEYARYNDMYQSLIDHLSAAEPDQTIMQWLLYALTTPGVMETEISIFANGSKCRLDGRFMAGDIRVGVELKSARDASTDAFSRACGSLHYDLQVEHYKQVCVDAGEPLDVMAIIAVETEAPYGVNIFLDIDETFVLNGRRKRQYAISQWEEYQRRGLPVAYRPTASPLQLPAWATYGPWEDETV